MLSKLLSLFSSSTSSTSAAATAATSHFVESGCYIGQTPVPTAYRVGAMNDDVVALLLNDLNLSMNELENESKENQVIGARKVCCNQLCVLVFKKR